ncbi:hypothetical protein ABT340_19120 [Streptosporangium sp. NPDC000239]|uniref:hypothetical protein n=1 Tax=Streptosporangium sp. NPDC000239 TaxID=3154248 RepID=UPI00333120A7
MAKHYDTTRLAEEDPREERPTEDAEVIIMGAGGHGGKQRLVKETVQESGVNVPHLVTEAALARPRDQEHPSTVDRSVLARQLSALLREPDQADDDVDRLAARAEAPPAASVQAQVTLRVPGETDRRRAPGARPGPESVKSSPAPRSAVVRPARTSHRRGR